MEEQKVIDQEAIEAQKRETFIARAMREANERAERWVKRQIKKYGHVPQPIRCPKCNRPVGLKGDAPAIKKHNPITGADYYEHRECKPERRKIGDLPKEKQQIINGARIERDGGGGPNPEREER